MLAFMFFGSVAITARAVSRTSYHPHLYWPLVTDLLVTANAYNFQSDHWLKTPGLLFKNSSFFIIACSNSLHCTNLSLLNKTKMYLSHFASAKSCYTDKTSHIMVKHERPCYTTFCKITEPLRALSLVDRCV